MSFELNGSKWEVGRFESFKHLIGRQHTLFWHHVNWQSTTAGNRKSERNDFSPNLHLTSDKLAFWEMFWGHYSGSRIPEGRLQSDVHPYTLNPNLCKAASSMETVWLRLFIKSLQSYRKNPQLFSCINNLWGFEKCSISTLVRPSVNLCDDLKVTNIRKKKFKVWKTVDTSSAANFKAEAPMELSPKNFNPLQREWSILTHLPS